MQAPTNTHECSGSTDEQIGQKVLASEQLVLQAIEQEELASLALSSWAAVLVEVEQAVRAEALATETLSLCRAVAGRIQCVAEVMSGMKERANLSTAEAAQRTRSLCTEPGAFDLPAPRARSVTPDSLPSLDSSPTSSTSSIDLFTSPNPTPPTTTTATAPPPDPHGPYRTFFLSHLAHPYPSPRDLQHLSTLVPDSTPSRVRTWFINSRRRSGWANFYRNHCASSREKLDAIIARDAAGEELAGEMGEDLAAVKEYFSDGERGVGEELRALLDRGLTLDDENAARSKEERKKGRDAAQAALGLGRIKEDPEAEKEEEEAETEFVAERVVSDASSTNLSRCPSLTVSNATTRSASGSSLESWIADNAAQTNPDYFANLAPPITNNSGASFIYNASPTPAAPRLVRNGQSYPAPLARPTLTSHNSAPSVAYSYPSAPLSPHSQSFTPRSGSFTSSMMAAPPRSVGQSSQSWIFAAQPQHTQPQPQPQPPSPRRVTIPTRIEPNPYFATISEHPFGGMGYGTAGGMGQAAF